MSLVSSQQAAGMGGAGKPAGAQADNTFQNKEIRQLVVLVRYKPKPPPQAELDTMSAAEGMVKSVTGAIDSAVDAAESAISSIPGLEMFIKEKKTDSPSEKDYTYDYSDWDSKFSQIGPALQKINSNNKTDTFEFSSTDVDGRKTDGKQLFQKVNDGISGWSKYKVWIHFVGIGQGSNVINECTDLLAKDASFKSERWCIKSVIYVGASLYKKEHLLNTDTFKGEGQTFAFGSDFDLTQHAVNYFEPNDTLVQMIKDSNKNTISLAVGKVKLRVIKILALVLGGVEIHGIDQNFSDKFDKVKSEITGMIDDIIGFIKKISTDTAAFIKLGDLPEFGKMMDGLGEIPDQCKKKLDKFLSDLGDSATSQVIHHNVKMTPQDLAGVLNCLCPLVDHITQAMSLFKYESKTGADLAQQIIGNAGVTKVYAAADIYNADLSKVDPYYSKFSQKIKDLQPDMAKAYVSQAKNLIAQAAENGSDIKSFGDDQKIALAEAIYLMARPMLLSKEQVYKELLTLMNKFVNFDSLSKDITTNKLTDIPAGPLKSLNVSYPPELEDSIAKNNQELTRIKGYFSKNNFGMDADSQYFIFNSHNVVCSTMSDAVGFCLDQATMYLDYQRAAGNDNQFAATGSNTYKPAGSKQKDNVMPAQPLPK